MSDFGSSEGEAMASILSSKRRRCSRRSRLSSESDLEERKICSVSSSTTECKGCMAEEAEEAEKDVGPGPSIPYMQTRRTSERLQRKRTRSFSLPSREKVLDSILSGTELSNMYSQKRIRQLRPRKLVNNFLREHTYYVCHEDEYYDSDDGGMSDWIDDDDDESAESTLESDCREVKCRPQKKTAEASTSESIENCESDNDIPLSNARQKFRSRQNLNSDSDDSLTNRTKGKKRSQCSDSDENANNLQF